MSTDAGVSNFDRAIQFTQSPEVEGGYTVDNGGPTNYGITQNTLNAYNKKYGYADMDVRDMAPEYARQIAKEVYYDGPRLDMLPDRVGVAAFDYGFNSGPYQAIKDLQRVVGVKADGLMGPGTQRAVQKYINANGEDMLLKNYIDKRVDLMNSLVANHPQTYGDKVNGWNNRIDNLWNYLGVGSGQSNTGQQQ